MNLSKTCGSCLLHDAKKIINGLAGLQVISSERKAHPRRAKSLVSERKRRLTAKNHVMMKESFREVIDAYNQARKDVADSGRLNEERSARLRQYELKEDKIEYRTWAFGADADGRNKATSLVLYEGINAHEERDKNEDKGGKKFLGRKRDVRENAKDHEDCISCLIQRAYRDSLEFRKFTNEFVAKSGAESIAANGNGFINPDESILQELRAEDKAEFLKNLIMGSPAIKDVHLVPPELEADTIAFNQMFVKEYPKFLAAENERRKARGREALSEHTELESLKDIPNSDPHDPENLLHRLAHNISAIPVTVPGRDAPVKFNISTEDLTYNSLPFSPISKMFEGLKKPEITTNGEIDKETGEPKKYFQLRTLENNERRKLLDVVKRLQVMDDAVGKYGNDVADRYQIANFSGASDLYAALLLFKETGIIKVENGKVMTEKQLVDDGKGGKEIKIISPKLSIQPLLETEQDQAHAPKMFDKLLDDDLIKSYYQALGKRADIMLGYSDGAKSAGNFASEWSIRNCARDLKVVFEKHGIKLRVLHGRGRGDSRGGQFEEGQNQRMMDPSLQKDMIYDVTMQSDLPWHMAVSPSFGKDTLAGVITGTITAKREAEVFEDSPALRARIASLDPVIQSLADTSRNEYRRLITKEPNVANTMKLLKVAHDNPLKSSRESGRDLTFEGQRAITVEYGFNMVDAQLHYCGLHKALDTFIASGASVQDKSGHSVSGKRALEVLYDSHPFFHDMMDKTARGLTDFDPNVFRQYAKIAGVENWAEECIAELAGTRELVEDIRHRRETRKSFYGETQPAGARSRVKISKVHVAASYGPKLRHEFKSTRQHDKNAEDPLRGYELNLNKKTDALTLALALGKDGEVHPLEDVTARLHYNPFYPDTSGASKEAAETIRNLTFVTTESNRSRGSLPPASIRAAVDHEPYRQR